MFDNPWTPEREGRLRELWTTGIVAREIAMDLGGFDGMSREGANAVVNKAYRLGLKPRAPIWSEVPELVDELKRLWDTGISCGEIAKQLGYGISRNAVIGKAGREKLQMRGKQKSGGDLTETKPRSRRRGRLSTAPTVISERFPYRDPSGPVLPAEVPKPSEFLGLEIGKLTKQTCHFPDGEKVPYSFCGAPTKKDSSYCGFHHRICYQPPVARSGNVQKSA